MTRNPLRWRHLAFATCVLAGYSAGVAGRAPAAVAIPGTVDIGFSQDMAVHHTQALAMARIVLARADASAPVRALASEIEASQAEEVGLMHGWLSAWRVPAVAVAPMSWMHGLICVHPDAERLSPMPGLATEPEMQQLRMANEPALDRIFVQLMLRHHYGGIAMIRAALLGAGTFQVRNAARGMLFEQMEEIGFMIQLTKSQNWDTRSG